MTFTSQPSPLLMALLLSIVVSGCASGPATREVPVVERSTEQSPPPPQQSVELEQTPAPEPPLGGSEPRNAQGEQRAAGPAPSTSVVIALLDTANRQQDAGQLPAAAASLERAVRIEPRNAETWYQLAVVRFQQGRLAQAEQLARKAEALAGGNSATRARSWRLIAKVREQAGDMAGARDAWERAAVLHPE